MEDYEFQQWQTRIGTARFIVALTGAGISRASGLPLGEEIVSGVSLKDFFRPDLVQRDPKQFYDLYRTLLKRWRSAIPNEAHITLALHHVWVITQNIDGLHRDAGTEHLIELHGNLRELHCVECGQTYGSSLVWREAQPVCKGCGSVLYPAVTLEGEAVRHFSRAVDWVGRAEVLLVIGTTLDMEPAHGLPAVAKRNGTPILWINDRAEWVLPRVFRMVH